MHYRTIAAGFAAVAMLVGCSAATPAGATPTAGTPAAGATATPTSAVIPTATPAATSTQPVPTSGGIVGSELSSRFPTVVDGQPVTNRVVERKIDVLRSSGMPAEGIELFRSTLAGIGIDLETVIDGSGMTPVGPYNVGIFALQVPGHQAAELIPVLEILATGGRSGDVQSLETVGGKSVTVLRSASGVASLYMYPDGDIMWYTGSGGAEEAFFTAL
jgi:hypothetical protein